MEEMARPSVVVKERRHLLWDSRVTGHLMPFNSIQVKCFLPDTEKELLSPFMDHGTGRR